MDGKRWRGSRVVYLAAPMLESLMGVFLLETRRGNQKKKKINERKKEAGNYCSRKNTQEQKEKNENPGIGIEMAEQRLFFQ